MDDIIFKKAQKGDFDAFEALIKTYEKLIYNAAYRMMGNQMDAEDASQEIILKVYKNLAACKNPEAFKSWLFRIINNTCVDEMRKRKGKATLSLDFEFTDPDSHSENPALKDETTPESELMRKDLNRSIQNAINKLSPDYKVVIVMRDISGMSYEEIANSLAISIGTVKSRIARARGRLREELLGLKVL